MRLTIIGRNPQEANIVLNSQYISNYHAEIIQLDNGDMFLVDKSTNGTFLNGNRLTPGKEVAIKRGDNIMFADIPLNWSMIDDVRVPKDVKQIKGIGSHYMNTINVQGPNVSRFHATIRQMSDNKWYICDHSKNGTLLNGTRLQKDRYVRLKKGDEITCGGVPVQNPISGGSSAWKWIAGVVAAACICAVAVLLGTTFKWSAEKTHRVYSPTVSWVLTEYHFEVSCPGIDLERLKVPTKFCLDLDKNNSFTRFDGTNSMSSQGTGFFVGEGGNVVTNRHVARPWEYMPGYLSKGASTNTIVEAAEATFRQLLVSNYSHYLEIIIPHISKLQIKGVVDGTYLISNQTYFDRTNIINCHEVACSSLEEDLAVFKVRNNLVQANFASVPLDKINMNELSIGNQVYTIGFPFGLNIQDYEKTPLQSYFADGKVSNQNDAVKFGLTAISYHGASGSPVFDTKGNLVGVLNSGIDQSQGYNFAIKAKCLYSLLQKANIIK